MAVFPDRIVLKNSTDTDAEIRSAISVGGSDEIHPGEIVVGRKNGAVALYSLDADNTIVDVTGGTAATYLDALSDVNVGKNWYSWIEAGDPLPFLNSDTVTTEQFYDGTQSVKSTNPGFASVLYDVFPNQSARYDAWSFWFRSTLSHTNNTYVIPLGGVLGQGSLNERGFSLYSSGGNILFASNSFVFNLGTHSYLNANTWYHFAVQLDWGAVPNRSVAPKVSVWLNGSLVVTNVTPGISFASGDSTDFLFNAYGGSSYSKYYDGLHVAQSVSSAVVLMTANTTPTLFQDAIKALGPTKGSSLVYNGGEWVDGAANVVASIDDLSDVDTTTNPPSNGQVLSWDGTNWVPAVSTGGGGSSITGTIIRKTETETASGGALTFSGIGSSGLLVSLYSDIDAWIVLYPTAASRTADSGRAYGTDPAPGSGVLAEAFVAAGTTVLVSPGTVYYNNDTTAADAIYAAVRDTGGANANAAVTVVAYAHQSFGGTGTNRVSDSGTAAGGTLDLTGLGQTGQLCTVTSSLNAWIVIYGSAAQRTADSGRSYNTDPVSGSGVMAEFYITAGSTVLATPGTTYFNNDIDPTEAIYLAVRDQTGVAVNSEVTITAYAETSYSGISGGTFGSG